MLGLLLPLLLQEGIGLPGGIIGPQEQLSERQRVVERLAGRLETTPTVGVFNADDPRCPLGADCPPPRPARGTVLVPGNAGMGDKVRERGKDVALDGGKVRRTPLRSLLAKLNPFHGKLRRGEDKKPVKLATPPRVD